MIWINIAGKPQNCRQDCFNLGGSDGMPANARVGCENIPLAENALMICGSTSSLASEFGKAIMTSLL